MAPDLFRTAVAAALLLASGMPPNDGINQQGPPVIQAPGRPDGADRPDGNARRLALSPLAFLHGRWEGVKTVYRADGSTLRSRSIDLVTPLMEGELLAIEGAGYAPDAIAGAAPIERNYGVLRIDPATGRLIVVAFANGDELRGEGRVVAPGQAEWRMQSPMGLLRFTVKAQDDGWRETIERSGDGGQSWTLAIAIEFSRAR